MLYIRGSHLSSPTWDARFLVDTPCWALAPCEPIPGVAPDAAAPVEQAPVYLPHRGRAPVDPVVRGSRPAAVPALAAPFLRSSLFALGPTAPWSAAATAAWLVCVADEAMRAVSSPGGRRAAATPQLAGAPISMGHSPVRYSPMRYSPMEPPSMSAIPMKSARMEQQPAERLFTGQAPIEVSSTGLGWPHPHPAQSPWRGTGLAALGQGAAPQGIGPSESRSTWGGFTGSSFSAGDTLQQACSQQSRLPSEQAPAGTSVPPGQGGAAQAAACAGLVIGGTLPAGPAFLKPSRESPLGWARFQGERGGEGVGEEASDIQHSLRVSPGRPA